MAKHRSAFQRANLLLLCFAALLLSLAFPVPAVAQEATPETTGPTSPPGDSGRTYHYNAETGMWENDYYIWDPVTKKTTPKTPQTYSYNPATGRWDTTEWIYDAAAGKYVPNNVTVVTPPAGAPTAGSPALNAQTQGPDSPINASANSNGLYDNFYNASISNTLNSNASTGNAAVASNTTGGNATSGDAAAIANLINILQSATSLQGGQLTTFIQDVGNWHGDLIIDPSQLTTAGPLSGVDTTTNNNLTINNEATGRIDNTLNLAANTGNADVLNNTRAGNATTGDAAAIANIVNVINSIISSGHSFVGTINIRGDLNGDILFPPDVLNSLLAASSSTPGTIQTGGPQSPINADVNNSLTANLSDNSSINNALNLAASTGNADVSGNTTAGNATTGDASTSLTVLNLTGRQVIGSNALLVFVNVMGKWVGMIVDAPAGSSAAAYGGNLSTNGPNSPIDTSANNNVDVNATTNNRINNNINLRANSGNASVAGNTTAGNATSGDAKAALNLLNILNSSFSLADWFGILFINVFGSWNGSFGIDTAAGNPIVAGPSNAGGSNSAGGNAVKEVRVFRFVPAASGSENDNKFRLSAVAAQDGSDESATSDDFFPTMGASAQGGSPLAGGGFNFLFPVIGGLIGVGLLGAEKIIKRREETNSLRSFSRLVFRGKL